MPPGILYVWFVVIVIAVVVGEGFIQIASRPKRLGFFLIGFSALSGTVWGIDGDAESLIFTLATIGFTLFTPLIRAIVFVYKKRSKQWTITDGAKCAAMVVASLPAFAYTNFWFGAH